ncbi:MAG: pirin family protein [Burkholderiaceae bacterium]|nr:pirin family protein [Burkholderiaceae bacterium]
MKKLAFIKRSNGSHWVGDGFPVQNIFSYNDIAEKISPFLMMDHAGPTVFPPTQEKLGVGQHPHRGFETVTIVYQGGVSHRDSSGGGGTIGPGDVQWMTAASGLIHEEFHSEDFAQQGGPFEMIQLWVNLPAKDKMSKPGYQGITSDKITDVLLANDAGTARIIAGAFENVKGAAHTFTPMNVWDLRLNAGKTLSLDLPKGHTTALYVLSGTLKIDTQIIKKAEMAVMEREGTALAAEIMEDAVVLLLSGEPLNEPIAGHGPFVMNTRAEITQAIQDYNNGMFGQIVATS